MLRPNILVHIAFHDRFESHLRPRLTRAPASELDSLLFALSCRTFVSRMVLKLDGWWQHASLFAPRTLTTHLAPWPNVQGFHGHWVWHTKVPNNVKIFAWLYFKDWLSTKANLMHKHIMEDSVCSRCSLEDRYHVFFDCPVSVELWKCIGLISFAITSDIDAWSLTPAPGLD
jgi:hypothetical protein